MAYKKKFKKGDQIKSLDQVVVLFNQKAFIWAHGKAYHYGWWSSWSFMTFYRLIWRGSLFYAVRVGNLKLIGVE